MQEFLQQGLEQLGVNAETEQLAALWQFIQLLQKWNKVFNLTAITETRAIIVQHLLDSLAINSLLEGERLIDVGTGAGLPGIPLAIMNPDKSFFLLDSRGKKTQFIQQLVISLQLSNVSVLHTRVESYRPEEGEKFDMLTSRAFASLEKMLTLCAHLIHRQGKFLAMKGRYPDDEIAQLPSGFKLETVKKLHIPEMNAERHLLILAMDSSTEQGR